MILYLDTSAYLKLFIEEDESARIRSAVAGATVVATHLITYAEMRAALAKAFRMGRETPEGLQTHTRELNRHWRHLTVIQPEETQVFRAGELAERFALRGYDSVHLAAAEALAGRFRERLEFRFAAYDRRLCEAARGLGIDLL